MHRLPLALALASVAAPLVAAQPGSALRLDGAGDYATLQNFPLGDSFTVEAWVDLSTDGNEAIFGKHDGTSTNVFIVGRFSNTYRVIIRGTTLSFGALPTDGPHHVAVTVRQDLVAGTSEVLAYLDGHLVGTANANNTVDNGTGDWGSREWLIGQEWDASASDFLLGSVDEARFWTTERSVGDIRDHMHESIPSTDPDFADLAAYYRFDGTGAAVEDETANGRDGTFVGDAERAPSPHPIGADVTQNDAALGFGTAEFASVGLTLEYRDFVDNGAGGGVTFLQADRFNEPPVQPPLGLGAAVDRYWTFHAFGAPTFTGTLTVDLGGAAGPLPPARDITLLARSQGGAWRVLGVADNVDGVDVTFAGLTEEDLDDAVLHVATRTAEQLSSSFDADDENWRTTPDARRNPYPEYLASGGNPGGYLTATDLASGDVWYFCAPAKYLGDQSALYGGVLRYDVRQNNASSQFASHDVRLEGRDGTRLVFDIEPNPATTWSPRSVTLLASSGWTVTDLSGAAATEQQMQDVLADLAAVCIRGEYRSGSDRGDLDNVFMLPPSVVLEGTDGWRTLSPPFPDLPLGGRTAGFLEPIFTAGYRGSDLFVEQYANVFFYDEATGDFFTPPDPGATAPIPTGSGIWVYVFEDDERDAGVQGSFPKVLSIFGVPLTTSHDFGVTYTPGGASGDYFPGINLLGNPYEVDLDWDHPDWVRTGVSNTLYIWDPALGVAGDYREWTPGLGGTLASGAIPVGQGFHALAVAGSPVLEAPAAARLTTRSSLYGLAEASGGPAPVSKGAPEAVPHLVFALREGEHEREMRVQFRPDATPGLDVHDGPRLTGPGDADALRLYALSAEAETGLVVASLPLAAEGPTTLGLGAERYRGGAPVASDATLSWRPLALPSGWQAALVDHRTGETYDLTVAGEAAVRLAPEDARSERPAAPAARSGPLAPPEAAVLKARGSSRFTIRVTQGVSTDGEAAPGEARVDAPVPNPARAGATLAVTLPAAGEVAVEVSDVLGRRVRVAHDGPLAAGRTGIPVDLAGLAPGVYTVVVRGAVRAAHRLTVVR